LGQVLSSLEKGTPHPSKLLVRSAYFRTLESRRGFAALSLPFSLLPSYELRGRVRWRIGPPLLTPCSPPFSGDGDPAVRRLCSNPFPARVRSEAGSATQYVRRSSQLNVGLQSAQNFGQEFLV